MPLSVRCTLSTPPLAGPASVPPQQAAPASPPRVGNAPLPAAAVTVAVATATSDPTDLAADASALCRDEGLPATIAWMKQHDGAWSNTERAHVLQGVTLALPTDRAWRALAAVAPHDADAVRPELERYRDALRTLGHAMEAFHAPVLAGRTGFLARSQAVRHTLGELAPAWLPGPLRRAAAQAAAGLHSLAGQPSSIDLYLFLSVCIGWQQALPAAARDLAAQELPQLWFDYALGTDGPCCGMARDQFWMLAILGSELTAESDRYVVDPARYEGAVIELLRGGEPADSVCARFHMDLEPAFQRWVHHVADKLQQGRALQRGDALNLW